MNTQGYSGRGGAAIGLSQAIGPGQMVEHESGTPILALGRQEQIIAALREELLGLREKLQPVMRAAPPTPQAESRAQSGSPGHSSLPGSSQVTLFVHNNANSLVDLLNFTQALRADIEL